MMSSGLLIVFSGPSGAGKDTILKRLLEKDKNIRLSISATTRSPRNGEVDGVDYYFVDKNKFISMQQNDDMLESAEYCGNFYGTPKSPIEKWTSEGNNVILEIEVQGGSQIKQKIPECVSIFILPPSIDELEYRLKNRKTENDETIANRLKTARNEILQAVNYDYAVVNDTVENAVDEIINIVHAEIHKVNRNKKLVERILENA